MDIRELKMAIETKSLSDDQLILKLENESSWFIVKQYIDKIAYYKGLDIKYIDSFDEIATQGFFEDSSLYIYKVDELKEFNNVKNSIIVCNKTNKDCINIPGLEHWQFIDYMVTLVPGVQKSDLEWLITQYETTYGRDTKTNYFRLKNDLDKISIFPESIQSQVFNLLYDSGDFSTTSNLTIFDLSNALMKKDFRTIVEVLKVRDYIDFNDPPVWLLSILLNSFRNVINIQFRPDAKAEELGMKENQWWAVKKNNIGYYPDSNLIKIYKLLTKTEYSYKFEGLPAADLVDYLIIKVLSEA